MTSTPNDARATTLGPYNRRPANSVTPAARTRASGAQPARQAFGVVLVCTRKSDYAFGN
jgi:hypothetical protein